MKLIEIFNKENNKFVVKRYKPKIIKISDCKKNSEYEMEVFQYLNDNKDKLSIKEVYKCNNVKIDGIIQINDDSIILVEIKKKLSWVSCSHARIQLDLFLNNYKKYKRRNSAFNLLKWYRKKRGLIIFKNFDDDWGEKNSKNCNIEKGWSQFSDHQKILKRFPKKLLQFDGKNFHTIIKQDGTLIKSGL